MKKSRKSSAKTVDRGKDGKFLPGNPGRLRGTRNRHTIAAESLLDGEAKALTRKVIELAKAGDISALRICIDRLIPTRRDAPIEIDLEPIETAFDVAKALAKITSDMASGDLTPLEAKAAASVIQNMIGPLEIAEIEARISALETANKATP